MKMKRALQDLLGAHVSTQGGAAEAPARGVAIGATAIQVFTKTPNQWREPTVREADAAAFRSALAASGIRAVVSHDSYLINLATPGDALPGGVRTRVGFCLDTAQLHAAGYDVAKALEDVWEQFDREVGLKHLKCLHLNDSKGAAGSHLDRHQWIGEGTIGPEPFRRIMRDPRLAPVIKIIETPKGDDPIRHDRRMLRRLRAYARGGRPNSRTAQTVGRA